MPRLIGAFFLIKTYRKRGKKGKKGKKFNKREKEKYRKKSSVFLLFS
jgi:hypothetical protein